VPHGVSALRSLGHIDAIIAIIGRARTGKSALCNILFGADDVFVISNETDSCTKGIWMAPEPVEWEGKRVLVLDVEGTGDCDADPASEMALMMMSRLLASVLVYNTKDGPPSRDQLGKLSTLAQTSQRMAIKSSQEANQVAFFWLFRDLNLKCENFQEHFHTKVFEGQSHSEVAEQLRDHFGGITALRMRAPRFDDEDEDMIGIENVEQFGAKFHQDLTDVCTQLQKAAVDSPTPLSTGKGIAEYLELVSQTLNESDDVIQVSDLLHTLRVNELMDEAKEKFASDIKIPTDDDIRTFAQEVYDHLHQNHPHTSQSVWVEIQPRILDIDNPSSLVSLCITQNTKAIEQRIQQLMETATESFENEIKLPADPDTVREKAKEIFEELHQTVPGTVQSIWDTVEPKILAEDDRASLLSSHLAKNKQMCDECADKLLQEIKLEFASEVRIPTEDSDIHTNAHGVLIQLQKSKSKSDQMIPESVWDIVRPQVLDASNPSSLLSQYLASNTRDANERRLQLQKELKVDLDNRNSLADRDAFVDCWTTKLKGPSSVCEEWRSLVEREVDHHRAQFQQQEQVRLERARADAAEERARRAETEPWKLIGKAIDKAVFRPIGKSFKKLF
jgi:hypothetical protein